MRAANEEVTTSPLITTPFMTLDLGNRYDIMGVSKLTKFLVNYLDRLPSSKTNGNASNRRINLWYDVSEPAAIILTQVAGSSC